MRAGLVAIAGYVFALTRLFGLVDTGELFASSDGGTSWAVHSTLPVSDAAGLLRGSSGGELHLVSRSGTVYFSADGGLSWSGGGAVPASDVVAADFGLPASLLVLTASGTLWESMDGGTSFSVASTPTASDCVSLTHDAEGSLYVLTETGTVRESVDGGSSWVAKGALAASDAVEIEALDSSLLVLTGAGDVWSSSDAGSSWQAVGTTSQVHMSGMILGNPGTLFATTREGDVATSGDGVTWTWVGVINQVHVMALATDLAPVGADLLPPPAGALVLSSPRPNPRRGVGPSSFHFTLAGPERVRFAMFDVLGRRVAARKPDRFAQGGSYSVRWDPGVLPPGVYYVRLRTESGRSAGTRWVLIR